MSRGIYNLREVCREFTRNVGTATAEFEGVRTSSLGDLLAELNHP